MKILIISEFFPSQNSIASGRPYSWANYLSKKHSVTVITTNKELYNVSMEYVKDCSMFNLIEINSITNNFIGKMKWVLKSYFLLRKNHYDIIISTSNPWQSHLIGYLLKKNMVNTKWITDFRDLWSINHYSNTDHISLSNRIHKFLEKNIIAKSDMITTVSQPLVEDMKKLHNEKEINVIYNGYEKFYNPKIKSSKKITIVYTGTIYTQKRDPSPLFKAINELLKENKLKEDNIEVLFYGSRLGDLEDIIQESNISTNIVKVMQEVSREESIKVQQNADLLLLLEWKDAINKGILTGKLFEYMASGTPIISIGPDESFSASKVIKESNTGFICSDNINKIKKVLLAKNEIFKPNIKYIEQFSREHQARILEEMIID
jgi:glycosyltransferase involved in cell wall biosynthesis